MPTQEPRTQTELVAYARNIMQTLIAKYHSDGDVFTDLDDKSTGLVYRCAGSLSLLLLVNGFDKLATENGWAEIVTAEFANVTEHIKYKGFDATPLKAEAVTANIFSPQAPTTYHYLDSVSWVLSFALHIRLAERFQRLELDDLQHKTVFDVIKNCLSILCEAGMADGGWGFTRGTTKQDLYYSYAVSESLADFGDYVQGESKNEINIDADEELQAFLRAADKELITTVQEKRKLTAKWLWETYRDELGVNEINPGLKLDPDAKSHILLYFTYFVIDMLIVNLPDEVFEDDEYFKQHKNQIYRKIEHALYLSRIDFDKAHDDEDWWKAYDESSLELVWNTFENPKLFDPKKIKLSSTQIYEPGFVPLSLRCNALYAFYIAEGPDQKMAKLFKVLHDNRDPDTGLWDSESYSLMVTERAIEAVVDYNDYLTRFQIDDMLPEAPVPEPSRIENAFREVIKEEVRNYLAASRSTLGQAPATPTGLTESALMETLKDLLAKGGKYLLDGKPDPAINSEDFEIFELTFRQFLYALMFRRLTESVPGEKQKQLRKFGDASIEKLMDAMGPHLIDESCVDLGYALTHLMETAGKQRDKLRARG